MLDCHPHGSQCVYRCWDSNTSFLRKSRVVVIWYSWWQMDNHAVHGLFRVAGNYHDLELDHTQRIIATQEHKHSCIFSDSHFGNWISLMRVHKRGFTFRIRWITIAYVRWYWDQVLEEPYLIQSICIRTNCKDVYRDEDKLGAQNWRFSPVCKNKLDMQVIGKDFCCGFQMPDCAAITKLPWQSIHFRY